ncbi:hypothetical protein M1M38_gp038 [Halorubrum tailed virus 27]|uniref:Uncharacterized protein n=1 Tax=Halorubrum tailed virus 27 TaxID=2878008 RepID=A0AAE8XZV6_9CAUD|nr:hypothetical protein M1M38_gp038 [Halorubrum tailed virus 27]UBF22731.1 hypothetical protein HRTV-27_gp38 [Halorubrum tailed virus 27]
MAAMPFIGPDGATTVGDWWKCCRRPVLRENRPTNACCLSI